MSKIFTIEYKEVYSERYNVRANSYEEAKEILDYAIREGLSGPEHCYDSSMDLYGVSEDDGSEVDAE